MRSSAALSAATATIGSASPTASGAGSMCSAKRGPIVATAVDAFAIREYHRRAGAVREAAQQRHRQRGHAEERCEFAVATLGLLVGQDADHAAVLQQLEQLAHAGAFGADLGYARRRWRRRRARGAGRRRRWAIPAVRTGSPAACARRATGSAAPSCHSAAPPRSRRGQPRSPHRTVVRRGVRGSARGSRRADASTAAASRSPAARSCGRCVAAVPRAARADRSG